MTIAYHYNRSCLLMKSKSLSSSREKRRKCFFTCSQTRTWSHEKIIRNNVNTIWKFLLSSTTPSKVKTVYSSSKLHWFILNIPCQVWRSTLKESILGILFLKGFSFPSTERLHCIFVHRRTLFSFLSNPIPRTGLLEAAYYFSESTSTWSESSSSSSTTASQVKVVSLFWALPIFFLSPPLLICQLFRI